ncbi:HAD family hydrolase [Halopseudomonas maritima]|uniref:HAD family hydrolase n=1 Tax=Halopseudomonas maritima TaxID=2918528 RepID=UPI001EECD972|nr:HAD family hydrolase [Halopseudomonas maritima]UJJ30435.1 haloacid dehalogenase-like hydrolase [Halopseudomonas maritima]
MKGLVTLLTLLISMGCMAESSEVLPSWQDTAARQRIIAFVTEVTDPASANHVPASERIAVFDNDGTLWAEQPIYPQLFFVADRIRALASEHPEWQTEEPFASMLKGDIASAFGSSHDAAIKLVRASQAELDTDTFDQVVRDWMQTARHPATNKPYSKMTYQPMRELLTYLESNGFKNFIVSGGGIDFMRPWTEAVYGIPPERVVGSRVAKRFELSDDSARVVHEGTLEFNDDKEGKPIGISQHIGRRPIAAFGNSDGDLQMLQWTTAGAGPRLGVIIHHTDAEREWAYDRESSVGKLSEALDQAPQRGWVVVDMKQDWQRVFPE